MFRWFVLFAFLITFFLVSCNSGTVSIGQGQSSNAGNLKLTQLLTAEFERQIEAQGGKGISDVTGVFVDPLMRYNKDGNSRVEWSYNNTGDYDQNSEVNIADVTQIALHFGKSNGFPDWGSGSAADGDGNGEVNLADISPIAVNFKSSVSNYVVEADIQGNGTWVPVANVAI